MIETSLKFALFTKKENVIEESFVLSDTTKDKKRKLKMLIKAFESDSTVKTILMLSEFFKESP